ncbi:MAG: hypothetical protein K0Q49_752 [Haloplasmataceae bacterium]|jgi:signal transduction histidine kinase|nr:hypothetical protein [Haloplasmataceae bacterium]
MEMSKRVQTIQTKLTLSYILYILLFVLLITIFSNILIQNQFKAYSIDKQTKQIETFVSQISSAYQEGWQDSSVKAIGTYALNEGYIMKIENMNHDVIWDANVHDGHQCEMIKEDIRQRMYQINSNWSGDFVNASYKIESGSLEVGTLQIEYFNNFYTEDDAAFLSVLNKVYLYSSIVFIIIGFIFASYMSKRLSNPIEKVVHASQLISKGIYNKLEINKSNLLEINTLTDSINHLSTNLSNQEKIRKQLTADVTHELRTPLTILQTHIEAMIDGVLETNEAQLKSIQVEIIRLTKMVADLDKLSRYDKQDIVLNKENVNLKDIIKNVVNIFQIEFQKKSVDLTYETSDIEILVDKDKISQVLINLLSNALKYTDSGGKVTIVVNDDHKYVVIKINDTGIGIDEKDLPYIFERFYRVDKSRNRATGGSGIGLTIVKSIVLAHNGNIEAKSEIGKGSEIMIELPKSDKNLGGKNAKV